MRACGPRKMREAKMSAGGRERGTWAWGGLSPSLHSVLGMKRCRSLWIVVVVGRTTESERGVVRPTSSKVVLWSRKV